MLCTRQYSGHKSCFLPHPRGQRYLFSSPIFRARGCELTLSMTKIGAKRRKFWPFSIPKVAKWFELGRNQGKLGRNLGNLGNKTLRMYIFPHSGEFFGGSGAVFFPTFQNSCFLPPPPGATLARIYTGDQKLYHLALYFHN